MFYANGSSLMSFFYSYTLCICTGFDEVMFCDVVYCHLTLLRLFWISVFYDYGLYLVLTCTILWATSADDTLM